MEVRLLGPVEVYSAGVLVDAGQPRQRCVLAVLAANAGQPVPADALVDRVWGEEPPRRARQALYVYVTGIRKLIELADCGGAARLVRRSGGYLLDIDPDRVDLHRFRRLVGQARDRACPPPQRVALLQQALGLWHDTPLANLPGDWATRTRESWRAEHLDVVIAWAYAAHATGDAGRVVAPLTTLVEQYPLNEALIAALMQALHAAGRSADALGCYARTRARLAQQLGTDPGSELQTLHQAILRGDLNQLLPTPVSKPPAASAVPAQLPADVHGFTGRGDELARLDTLLASDDQPTAVVISAVSGTAGVGKTALAVHWAHQVTDRFPDGQLYVNLRGFDPTGTVVTPAETIRRFLDALQVPPRRVPADLDAQAALYRTLLTGKRMLIVLDNARDADQVRPLLPGAPGSLVLVTSRNRLTSLIAAEAAHPLPLDLLTVDEARDLLARRLGTPRVIAEPDEVDEIITRCARLPLALSIVAANAATQPRLPLAALADQLHNAHDQLDALSTGDSPTTDLRAVFSWSYQTLSENSARLFRFLGLHPGPDTSIPAAASLAALPIDQARQLLRELADAHLIVEHTPGRYTLHDLLHAYANWLTHAIDTDVSRQDAGRRMLDYYLHSAHAAALQLDPHRNPITVAARGPGTILERPADRAAAMAWFAAEQAVLPGLVDHAARNSFDVHAWQLAWALVDFLHFQGRWHDLVTVHSTALGATRRLSDHAGQARAHHGLAGAYVKLGDLDTAQTHYEQALDLYHEQHDRDSQARVCYNLAALFGRRERQREALHYAWRALQLYQATGNICGQADALNTVGWFHAELGNYRQALDYCQQALTLHRASGDDRGMADTLDSIGYAHHHLGNYRAAVDAYRSALDVFRMVADKYQEADTLVHLGDALDAASDCGAAHNAYRNALTILDELDHPDAEHVRTKLHHLDHIPPHTTGRDHDPTPPD